MTTDWREKYETLLREVKKPLEETYLVAQRQAEMNIEASKNYVEDLQSQLERSRNEVKELKKKLESRASPSVISIGSSSSDKDNKPAQNQHELLSYHKTLFLESLTCLSVIPVSLNEYKCTLDDGKLNGHQFKLQLDRSSWEYTYTPTDPSKCLKGEDEFLQTFFFPDYMLPRFLIKLLTATYQDDN